MRVRHGEEIQEAEIVIAGERQDPRVLPGLDQEIEHAARIRAGDDMIREMDDAPVARLPPLAVARDRVERHLSRINPRYALAIRLRVLEERSREEAARELDVSVSTFDVVLHRAMAALRKAMQLDGGETP